MNRSTDNNEPRGPIAWMAGHSVAANLLMGVLLLGGLIVAFRIKQEVFPEFDLDMVQVSVVYPGASPDEIEQGIILAIEEEVRGLDGVKQVTSNAAEGIGVVSVELLLGSDPQRAAADVQNAVDRILSFPVEAEKPRVTIPVRRLHVVDVIVYGEVDDRALRETTEQVRDILLQDPGITLVELPNVRPYEISIEVSQETLRAYNLTLGDIAAKIRRSSIELPGGGIKTEGGEVLLRMTERRDYGREFRDLAVLTRPDGTEVRLGEIADIRDGFEDRDIESSYNGQPALTIRVYRVGDETPISVADTVTRYVADLGGALPPGIRLATWNDTSEIYRQRMNLLLRNAAIGLVLVLVLLSVFLEARLAFWVTMGIPISFLGGLLLLPLLGVSINMISLFAFIVALGIVVDDAIVVGENIYEYHQRGMPFRKAAARAAREVMMPVTFSVLTNIVAFMPMFFVPGIMGKIFRVIPAVVVLVFLVSLVESLFILPAHLGHHHERDRPRWRGWLHRRQQRFSLWFAHLVRDRYGPFLGAALQHRYLTMAAGVALLVLTVGFIRSGRMGLTLFPRVDADIAMVTASLPYGSSVERTRQVQQSLLAAGLRVAESVGRDRQLVAYKTTIGQTEDDAILVGGEGGAGGHISNVEFLLTDPDTRILNTEQFIKQWRREVRELAGLESLVFRSDVGGPGAGASLTVELSHRSLDVLERASAELAEALRFFPNVKDIDDGFSPGKRQVDFAVRPEGEALGLTALDVARQVRDAFYGAEVTRQQRGRNEMKIMVRLPADDRVSEYNLEEFIVRAADGRETMLREVVDMDRGRAYTVIQRRNGRRVVSVTADVDPPSQSNQVLETVKADTLPALAATYPGLRFSFEGRQADMTDSIESLMVGFVFAMMVIYALLAIAFRSYIQPVIIMVCIPFGLVGAVIGHIVMGYSLSIMSMFGLVALSGVVVNDSLILIEFANRRTRDGQDVLTAIREAAVRRFRPIMLTTLTTFGGLAPMMFEQSRQARFLIPMALSLGYGILFATVITLVLVPSLYVILDDVRKLRQQRQC